MGPSQITLISLIREDNIQRVRVTPNTIRLVLCYRDEDELEMTVFEDEPIFDLLNRELYDRNLR